MNNIETLASEYAKQIENYVNNWSTDTLESQMDLEIFDEEKQECITVRNFWNYGKDTTTRYLLLILNDSAGGSAIFNKGNDIQEIYQQAKLMMMYNENKRKININNFPIGIYNDLQEKILNDCAESIMHDYWWQSASVFEYSWTVAECENDEYIMLRLVFDTKTVELHAYLEFDNGKPIVGKVYRQGTPVDTFECAIEWASNELEYLKKNNVKPQPTQGTTQTNTEKTQAPA